MSEQGLTSQPTVSVILEAVLAVNH